MEQDAVWYVLQHVAALEDWGGKKDAETRSLAHRRSDKSRELPFDVKAAFTRSVAPGYIFVEANTVKDVELVCQGFVGFRSRSRNITVVPMDDSVTLLKHQPSHLQLHTNTWVRIRRGEYAADIGYLYDLESNTVATKCSNITGGVASVWVIPRISNMPVPDKRVAKTDSLYPSSSRSGKRKRAPGRPVPNFFQALLWKDEAAKGKEPDTWRFRGKNYTSGLLDLQIPINVLNLGLTTPNRAELQRWVMCQNEDISMFARDCLERLAEDFWVDDRIEVIGGEYVTQQGIVRDVGEQTLSVLIPTDDSPDEKREFLTVEIPTECVRKVFNIGDFVEVASAQDAELQGFVVGIESTNRAGDTVTIMKPGFQDPVSGPMCFFALLSYFCQFSSNSSSLHLRDPPFQLRSMGQTTLTPDEVLLMRTVPRRNPKQPRYHQRLWQGMPVLVLNKLAKGLQGEIRDVHEEYKLDESKKTRTNFQGIQEYATGHLCAADCHSCIIQVQGGHVCSTKCERCRLVNTKFSIDEAEQSFP
jgi:hypothetical protein